MARLLIGGLAVAVAFAGFAPLGAAAAPTATIVQPSVTGDAWRPDEVASLTSAVDALLAAPGPLAGAHVGVLALDTRTGEQLYARNADDAFQAASATKLVVGSAALDKLGPAFRFRTTAFLDAGRLVLSGGGDPFLNDADFAGLSGAVAATGVRRLAGLAIDDSRYDRVPYPDGWTLDDVPYDYAPEVSALTFDENAVHITVSPGPRAAAPPTYAIQGGVFRINAHECRPASDFSVVPAATTGAAGSELILDLQRERNGCIRVIGSIPAGAPSTTLDAAVPNPARYAAAMLASALLARGVAVAAASVAGAPLAGAARHPLWAHDSPALQDFLGPAFWVPSDNLVAELLLKELGGASVGGQGTSAKGTAVEAAWLASLGVGPASASLFDGSGLSRYDRITPRALGAVLQHDWNGPYRQIVLDSLPVGGARGTIEGLAGTAAAGRVFAKTGSFMHVRGLAGYLATQSHGGVTFAFIVDDWTGTDYVALAALRARVLALIVGGGSPGAAGR